VKIKIPEIVLSLVFSLITIFGYSYKQINSWDLVFQYPIRFLLLFFIYFILFLVLIILIENIVMIKNKKNGSKISIIVFDKYPILIPLIVILICWLPYLIIKYPGTPGWDFYHFLNNYYEYDETLTHHFPLVYVFMCIYVIKFGILINNINLGLFLLTLIHATIMAVSFSIVFRYLKKWEISYKFRWLILLFYSLMPLFGNYATTIYHDTIYSSFILIYVLLLTDIVKDNNLTNKKYIIISILSLLLCLTRKNGIFIVLPTNLYLLIKYLFNKNWKKQMIKIICCIIPILLSLLSNYLFSLKYVKTSYLESMAIPLQQIARYSRDYHDDITDEEKYKIDRIVNYNYAGILYNPTIVDDVRNNYGNYFPTNQEVEDFLITWIKLFPRHPDAYVQAAINTVFPLYYPFTNATFTFFEVKEESNYNTYLNFSSPEELRKVKDKLKQLHYSFEEVPLLQYINDPGIYVWCMFLIIMIQFKEKKKRWLPLVPLIMTFICCLNAPTINYNSRYVFPIIFSVFPLLAFYSSIIKKDKQTE